MSEVRVFWITKIVLVGAVLAATMPSIGSRASGDFIPTLDAQKYLVGQAPSQSQAREITQSTADAVESAHEQPAAISNGSSYGIIAPLYLYADPLSLIRLVNGDLTPTTFNISVVGVPSGNNLGTAQFVVPGAAALQKSISDIITAANATPGASDTTYSFYIQSSGQLAGYQHIIFSNSSGFLENVSVCKYNLNQSFSAAAYAEGVISVHTSVLADGAYPSQIEIHNYASTTQTYVLSVYEATSGALKGRASLTAAANSTYLIPFAAGIEPVIGWSPLPAEIHANVVLSTTTGTTPPQASIGHTIVNTRQTNTVLNMTNVCAVNPPPSVVVTPTTPTSYCGTLQYSTYPYSFIPIAFTAALSANGKLTGTLYGEGLGLVVGGTFTGTKSGTSFAATSPQGGIGSGTIQNNTLNGSFVGVLGTGTISGSASACN